MGCSASKNSLNNVPVPNDSLEFVKKIAAGKKTDEYIPRDEHPLLRCDIQNEGTVGEESISNSIGSSQKHPTELQI